MADFDLRNVEFRSDGMTDSLTTSMSPALFVENVKREIATAAREARELTMVTVALAPTGFKSLAIYQEALIAIAFAIQDGLRGGDFFGRISDSGFWILLRTDESGAAGVINRLDLPHHGNLEIHTVARRYSGLSEWIERIDQLYFS
jgi:GGDEF domain-containing protein